MGDEQRSGAFERGGRARVPPGTAKRVRLATRERRPATKLVARKRVRRYDNYRSGSVELAAIRPRSGTGFIPTPGQTLEEATLVQTVKKNTRVTPGQRERVLGAAAERNILRIAPELPPNSGDDTDSGG